LRFSLRTFLVLTMIAGVAPWLHVQRRQQRESELWKKFDDSRAERARVLQQWRTAYAALVEDKTSSPTESALRERYFAARDDMEKKWQDIRSFYGDSPKERPERIARGKTSSRQ
jgi:DNA/RNA-binding domain of Phe-tRNA-synthetase-like protein